MNLYKIKKRLDKDLTKEKLIYLYRKQNKSSTEIAKIYNVCHSCILKRLKNYNIKIRTQSESHKGILLKTRIKKLFTKKYLYREYIIKKRKTVNIANQHNTYHSIVCKYLKLYNIPRRKACGITKGKNHWNWHGGISKDGHSLYFLKNRDKIRERDNYKCKLCGMSQEKCIIKYGCKINVHHIDYNKQNDEFINLISLCKKCHGHVHTSKKDWIKIFQKLIKLEE